MANGCTQSVSSSKGATWSCTSLQCTCRPGASFCGGGSLNLTNTIDGLTGDLTIACDPLTSSGTASCSFQQSLLESVFGSSGLSLTGCNFGECVQQGVIDATSNDSSTAGGNGNSLSGGVIGGLAAVGALIGLALFGFFLGWWARRKQRRLGAAYVGGGKHGGFAVEWSDVSYVVPQASGSGSWTRLGGSKTMGNDKVILDGISGRVEPGQLLGILGPSGARLSFRCEVVRSETMSF